MNTWCKFGSKEVSGESIGWEGPKGDEVLDVYSNMCIRIYYERILTQFYFCGEKGFAFRRRDDLVGTQRAVTF